MEEKQIKMENVYRVSAYYNSGFTDFESIQEIYSNEELAKKRVKELIASWKQNGYAKEEADIWGENEYDLCAFCDSEWNVNISYHKEEVLTEIPSQPHYDY